MESYNVTRTLNTKIGVAAGSNITVLIDNFIPPGQNIFAVNCTINTLRVKSFINSIASVSIPSQKLLQAETDRVYRNLDVEWASPRKQLELLLTSDGTTWNTIGSVSLMKLTGFPHQIHNLLDFFDADIGINLESYFKLGVQVSNAGHGLLAGDDFATIYGSYTQQFLIQTSAMAEPTTKFIGMQWNELNTDKTISTWFWDGTRWLSEQRSESFFLHYNADYFDGIHLNSNYNYLIKSFDCQVVTTTTLDANNRAEIYFKEWLINANSGVNLATKIYNSATANSSIKEEVTINQVIITTGQNSVQIKGNRVGVAIWYIRGFMKYHLIRK